MTGIHRRFPSFLARVVFPDPGRPVMMMHFGFLFMFLDAKLYLISRARELSVGCLEPATVGKSFSRFRGSSGVRVQLWLASEDVSSPHNSSKNTGSHSRAKAPLAPPAARKAISALSLI